MSEASTTPRHGHVAVRMGSERAFGWVFAVFGVVIAGVTLYKGWNALWWQIATAASVVFALLAEIRPRWLAPLNRAWFKLGMLLGAVIAPLVMGLIFFLVVTPIGVVRRLAGANPMRLGFDRKASSYWIARDPPGPEPEDLERQF